MASIHKGPAAARTSVTPRATAAPVVASPMVASPMVIVHGGSRASALRLERWAGRQLCQRSSPGESDQTLALWIRFLELGRELIEFTALSAARRAVTEFAHRVTYGRAAALASKRRSQLSIQDCTLSTRPGSRQETNRVAGSWKTPLYQYGKITIDVTSSISAGLGPHRRLADKFIPLANEKLKKRRVLDFGAGALRHTLPLLKANFEVCAVEFKEAFERKEAGEAIERAKASNNFSSLIWPEQFKNDRRRFDAALIIYVLQVMPEASEREAVIKYISGKLVEPGYLLYMSRWGQVTKEMKGRKLNDGCWMWPDRARHSFYTEFTHEQTNEMMERHGFKREASWSEGGTEQVFLYRKITGTWP